jgi:hypothetical protein
MQTVMATKHPIQAVHSGPHTEAYNSLKSETCALSSPRLSLVYCYLWTDVIVDLQDGAVEREGGGLSL